MIAAVTYSTKNYESLRKRNVKSAYRKGKAEIVFEFTPDDIDVEFQETNKAIFSHKKGAGLWLWKPYVINKALSLINDKDYLIYSDSASFYINKIEYLINALESSGQNIMTFELPLVSKQWTKQETFIQMKCEDKGFENRNQIMASFLLVKKNNSSVSFIKEYLDNCCNLTAISHEQFDQNILNPSVFLAHRQDQSILSILSMKHGIKPFRDPSQYGKRPWEYILSKEVIYNPKEYDNSNYPTIFLLTRIKVNSIYFFMKDIIKDVLSLSPLYINWEINKRNNISRTYPI